MVIFWWQQLDDFFGAYIDLDTGRVFSGDFSVATTLDTQTLKSFSCLPLCSRVAPASLPRRSRVAPASLPRRSRVALASLPRRSRVSPPSLPRRSCVAHASLPHRSRVAPASVPRRFRVVPAFSRVAPASHLLRSRFAVQEITRFCPF